VTGGWDEGESAIQHGCAGVVPNRCSTVASITPSRLNGREANPSRSRLRPANSSMTARGKLSSLSSAFQNFNLFLLFIRILACSCFLKPPLIAGDLGDPVERPFMADYCATQCTRQPERAT